MGIGYEVAKTDRAFWGEEQTRSPIAVMTAGQATTRPALAGRGCWQIFQVTLTNSQIRPRDR